MRTSMFLRLLGRDVVDATHHESRFRQCHRLLRDGARNPKSDSLTTSILRHQNVRRLDVAVQETLAMGISEPAGDLR